MSLPPIARDQCSIVVTGDMRPVAILPDWLRSEGIAGAADAADEKFELLVPSEAAIFTLGQVKYQVGARGLQLETSDQADFEPMRDIAVDILGAMPEKAIAQLGINRNVHFKAPSREAWHSVGDNLVNNPFWDGVLNLSGMRSATYWAVRSDRYGGRIQVQVEPSFHFPTSIFLAYNDHFDLTYVESQPQDRNELATWRDDTSLTTDKILVAREILNEGWNDSSKRFYNVLERLSHLMDV